MADVEEVHLPACTLHATKTKGGKEPHAEIVLRVALGEAWERAAPFLARVISEGHPVNIEIAEVQARMRMV